MKINFPTLFQTPLQKYRFFFIFGNDKEVFERAIYFIQKTLQRSLELRDEKDVLKPEVSQPSLFANSEEKSICLVSPVTDKILSQLETLKEGLFIFTSEKARAASKLVTTFSSAPESLAIAAYASPILSSEFNFLVEDMNLSKTFKDLLLKTYQNDYQGLFSTLAKIKLYGEVPENHYDSFLETSGVSDDVSPILHAFLNRDSKSVTQSFASLSAVDLIPFLRNLTRTFQTLYELLPFKKSTSNIPWQSLTSPVFFKDQPLYQAALPRWQEAEVLSFLESLLILERQIKYASFSLSQVKHQLLLRI